MADYKQLTTEEQERDVAGFDKGLAGIALTTEEQSDEIMVQGWKRGEAVRK